MLRVTAILLCSLALSGCFIADEINKGDALIEQHSVGWRNKKKQAQQAEQQAADAEANDQAAQAAGARPGVSDKLSEWWRDTVEERPVSVDPSDALVRCEIGGGTQFLRRSDCELRRGRASDLDAKTGARAAASSPGKPGS
ncbi:MAG TPA: hypothetical protein VEC18_02625 [Myxococcota bacterium]|nr:hypothetical protein [Myxococcota bacterium]